MKKLSLLLHHAEKSGLMKKLQEAGLLQIELKEEGATETERFKALYLMKKRSAQAVAYLEKVMPAISANRTKPVLPSPASSDPLTMLDSIESTVKAIQENESAQSAVLSDIRLLTPWGEHGPVMQNQLAEKGCAIRFFEAPDKVFHAIDLTDKAVEVISHENGKVLFMAIENGAVSLPIHANEIKLPDSTLPQAQERAALLKQETESLHQRLQEWFPLLPTLSRFAENQHSEFLLEQVSGSLQATAEGRLYFITGFFRADHEKPLSELLQTFSCYWESHDPSPDEEVPVLLENNAFFRLFEPITRLFALPSYHEMDPTPLFAPFFTFFVGLCLGDVGYGLIISIAALIAFKKAASPIVRSTALIVAILGGSAVVAGLLLNSCFGSTLFAGSGIPEGSSLLPLAWADHLCLLGPFQDASGSVYPAMAFAVCLGFFQITYASVIRTLHAIRHNGWLAGFYPISFLLMSIGAIGLIAHTNFLNLNLAELKVGRFAVGAALLHLSLTAYLGMAVSGLFFLLLFNHPEKSILVRPLTGLWDLYNFIFGYIGDLLSYLRLFALGLASGLLGSAFTQIAFGMITGPDGIRHFNSPLFLFTILILLVGHTLNVLLAMIGSFVHPLRLTFVEFYKNLNFQGGGKAFVPFSRTENKSSH
ncbi:MAG: hypothetical protein A2293_12465 [Elusimicrobia bacterium RIFOXYB2_FULL_49_7]|nr:MAG: hypothetical protein A2293_12465 [Elusimicrobia bacterium RIFOXYB2_FULL_49_7]